MQKSKELENSLDYETVEKIQDFLPFIYRLKITEEEFYADLLLYTGDKFDVLPELTKILPLNSLLKFLYIFAGKTIRIPEKRLLSLALRDLDIYYSYVNSPQKLELNRLSKKYNITSQNVLSVIAKIANNLNKPNPLNG